MNNFEIEGRVKLINDLMTFKSNFQKQEFVITTFDVSYPQDIKLEAVGKNVDIVAPLRVGDPVKVIFQIRGNEYQGKYFVNLQAKRIERAGEGAIDQNQKTEKVTNEDAFEGIELDKLDQTMESSSNSSEDDDLPF